MKIADNTEHVCVSVKVWLCICSIGILLMVLVGGITRLTHSGLSITEWNPVIGIFPPVSEKEWIAEKMKYMSTPEFKCLNFNITFQEFKKLYLIEYFHRLLGRIVGLIFLLPFLYFTYKKKLNKNLIVNFIIICVLILFQGVMGWLMVKSGLIDRPHVSHYRLTAHLLLALLIFYLLWRQFLSAVILNVTCNLKINNTLIFYVISILIVIQITFGSLVAGLNAGLLHKTVPFLEGRFMLEDLLFMKPLWSNIFDNPITVQFIHEVIAVLILVIVSATLLILRLNFFPSYLLLVCLLIQLTFGILTFIYNVPIALASLHQVTAFILFAINTYLLHCVKLLKLQHVKFVS
ncbi:COX15/CtaA family protein [Ehrlichia canis]|uniref:Heme A synthase n=1 Tax=Ehrlichia canis (strain Jake) TaxID=269484 RepID=CTAA_EHRCJ|nr:COX15/CtaA family protein [Ehrlichia canis]Q3YRB4.1 RecName: Full=Heme A synthase; Short=HAS; AltName: Full=Cytochrome aa3-controlling protein [Ehrlichia canis str. Jake]AAZ68741.1 Cytochrome oxidase assembly [Ehrlichia canis str. Jake]AUO54530.1 heme A synthase [Ehrlichia canis]UKC53268.1 heme A synthase [Ehrlichia canis]UKC54205.1 heme A synthase [Ehrlichia canis]UKC55141.1 heme A synthase [Ehrlichia canis]